MDALEYVASLRIAPDGSRLNTTQKLVLILLASSLDEGGASCPSKDVLADQALISTRSLKRNLAELEAMRLILPIPQYTDAGADAPSKYLILDAQGESVTRNTLPGGRVLPMTGESVTGRRESVTHDTLAGANRINNLASPAFGMKLAPPSPSNSINNGGGVLVPAAAKWAEVMQPYGVALTPEIASLIAHREPKNLPAWEYTLKGWVASTWAKTNIDGQLDRYYTKTLKSAEYAAQGNNAPSPPKTIEQSTEEELHRTIIYGGKVER